MSLAEEMVRYYQRVIDRTNEYIIARISELTLAQLDASRAVILEAEVRKAEWNTKG